MLAISERVVIRADDLLNWCDDTINWTYGLRANTLLDPTIKSESANDKCDDNSQATATTQQHDKNESDQGLDSISGKNIRSLKNSKLDFTEVEKEKGTTTHFTIFLHNFILNSFEKKNIKIN